MPTKISWTDETWNPITGCTPVSPGCLHCYARRMSRRHAGRFGYPEAPNHFDVTFHPDKLDRPLKWKKARRIFVCSMSDLFHEDVHTAWVNSIFHVMINLAPRHRYQILTKRPRRMLDFLLATRWLDRGKLEGKVKNIDFGVTAENQEQADSRIAELLKLKIHYPWLRLFVSMEPLLEEIDISEYLEPNWAEIFTKSEWEPVTRDDPLYASLDWVILGAETGPGARPMDLAWARSVRDQCIAAGVPFFFKRDSNGSQMLDGKVWRQFPEVNDGHSD